MRRIAAIVGLLLAGAIGIAALVLGRPFPDDVCAICDGDHPTEDHGFTEGGW